MAFLYDVLYKDKELYEGKGVRDDSTVLFTV